MKKVFMIYYQHDNETIDKMRIALDDEKGDNLESDTYLKEVFYDSVPYEGSKIMEIVEL